MICPRCKSSVKCIGDLKEHHKSLTCLKSDPWYKVVEARKTKKDTLVNRLTKKALGIKGKPMSEETKMKLRRHNEEHKEEIKARQKLKRATFRRLKNIRSYK